VTQRLYSFIFSKLPSQTASTVYGEPIIILAEETTSDKVVNSLGWVETGLEIKTLLPTPVEADLFLGNAFDCHREWVYNCQASFLKRQVDKIGILCLLD
jgi:hypothetical protein